MFTSKECDCKVDVVLQIRYHQEMTGNKTISFRFDDDLTQRLDACAEALRNQTGISTIGRADVAKAALDKGLAQMGYPAASKAEPAKRPSKAPPAKKAKKSSK
jgi:hypothetical protein